MNDTKNAHFKLNGTSSVVIILSRIAIMVMFTESMLIPALPTLQAEFNSTATWTAWILSIYLVVGTVSTSIFGKLGDSYGKKKLLFAAWRCTPLVSSPMGRVEYPEPSGL
jgi:MFS family permease